MYAARRLDEAEATPGEDVVAFDLDVDDPLISPQLALPTLTQAIVIDGSTHPDGIRIAGDAIPEGPGLYITAASARLTGLTLQTWAGDGIAFLPADGANAEIALTDVLVRDGCGWGVRSTGTVRVDGLTLYNNGIGRRCEGGGVVAALGILGAGLDAQTNGGPGVLSSGDVTLSGVVCLYNEGPGIATGGAVTLTGTSRRDADNRISDNLGAGIVAGADANVVSTVAADNGGWGIVAPQVTLGTADSTVVESVVSRNGFGEECYGWTVDAEGVATSSVVACQGGGVWAAGDVRVERAQSSGNNGPGVFAMGGIALHLARLEGNEAGGAQSGGGGAIVVTGDENFILDNYGRGLETGGTVSLEGSMAVSDNDSWGIWAGGDVRLFKAEDTSARRRAEIVRNGLGDLCFSWDAADGMVEVDCAGGGAVSREGLIEVADANIGSNGGPGLWGAGDVVVARVTLEENEGAGLQSDAAVRSVDGDVIVSNTYGDGIVANAAELSGVRIFDNQGTGVRSVGTVRLGFGSAEGVDVFRNGGGDECFAYSDVLNPVRVDVDCGTGGVVVTVGAYASRLTNVAGNVGDGIRVEGAAPDTQTGVLVSIEDGNLSENTAFAVVSTGDMNYFRGTVCGNGEGPFMVGGTIALVDVEVCGDTDGDGVANAVEDAVADGDGDGDGVPDSLQAHVAGLPREDGTWIVYVVEPPLSLLGVADANSGGSIPAGVVFPWDVQTVTVVGLGAGGRATVSIFTQADGAPTGYWYFDALTESYVSLADSLTAQGDGLSLQLTDGAGPDADGASDGQITLKGAATRTLAEEDDRPDGDTNNGDPGREDPTNAGETVPDPVCGCETPASGRPLWAGWFIRR